MKRKKLIILCFLLAVYAGRAQTKNPAYEAYIEKYKTIAVVQQEAYRIPASITLAQGLLESAAGNSSLARQGNNHFGIKCKEEWLGGRMYHDDDTKNECFRMYKSVEESFTDHSLFLANRSFYTSLFSLDLYDYRGWANGLQQCGYATDKSYAAKLVSIIETYELYRYDRTGSAAKAPEAVDMLESPERSVAINWRHRILETNGVHYVEAQEDDTYESVARDTRMKLKRLLKYNDATQEQALKKGDRIYLQGKRTYAAKGNTVHTVKEGESLHDISRLYGMKLQSLYKLNRIKDGHTLKAGDTLKVRK